MQILLSTQQIQQRIAELAGEIEPGYRGLPFTIVGVLTGSLFFVADLVRRLEIPLRIGLIQASSYRGKATSAGELHIASEILSDVRGRHVLLMDDILDTGQTLKHLVRHLLAQGALSVKICVLLRKLGKQVHTVNVDFVGFEIPDEFVVGYGLDFDDEYRNLPYIGVLPKEMYE